MRVTIETVIDESTTEQFLQLYRAAFDPLEGLAAGRQALTDDEFREEMRLETVLKFIGWDRRERPVAMVVIATDLETVPWVSPGFWRERYPETRSSVDVDTSWRGRATVARTGVLAPVDLPRPARPVSR